MARPLPTDQEILDQRGDLLEYIQASDDLQTVAARALTRFKMDIETERGVEWSQIWDSTNSKYFEDSDGNANNDVRVPFLLSLLTIWLVLRDYAIRAGEDDQWMAMSREYEREYTERMKSVKLDVDYDDSGAVSADEDGQDGQTFMGR